MSYTFTYNYGKITTNVNEFDAIFIKGNTYKMTIEKSKNYITGCVKYGGNDTTYGPGGRFMIEGDNDWIKAIIQTFLTPTQTEREKKLKELFYE